MTTHQPIQPIFILAEGSKRNTGKEAQRQNIEAAKLVAETIRTTLGPKGMDKMVVNGVGDITITNDGVTILEQMELVHPAAKMMVEIAKTQEKEIGDGTTTAVIIAGELLKKAEHMLEMNIHPTIIAKGYQIALEKALAQLQAIAILIDPQDKKTLKNIALTAMTGKGSE
ncbi:MAG: TCP-1/cpn60 chaperonin family protein, partial [Candidatus Woesearchaeota archaeon]